MLVIVVNTVNFGENNNLWNTDNWENQKLRLL